MEVDRETEARVRERATDRCEYCRMHQSLQGASFHIEHIQPKSLGGLTNFSNLALACPGCNLHKANRVTAIYPETGKATALFNPRTDHWEEHFEFHGYAVLGVTSVGRATVDALNFNHPRRIRIRQAEALFNLFPPPTQSS